MAIADTPTLITTAKSAADPTTTIDVSFTTENTNGDGGFNIQFVKIGDPTTVIPAPNNPQTPTKPATGDPWTADIVFTTPIDGDVTITDLLDDYQAQVQAVASSGNTDSPWGLQIYFHTGITLTIMIGGVKVVLGQTGLPDQYSLSSPVTVTYQDLSDFVATLPGGLTLPTTWPNGETISSSLTVETFAVNTQTKLFDINVVVDLDWVIIPGAGNNDAAILEADQLGIEVLRTNGQPLG